MFWKIKASIPAKTVEPIITGRVGFFIMEPAKIIKTGSSKKILKSYMASSCLSIVFTASEDTSLLPLFWKPTTAYTIREIMVAGMVVQNI